MATKRQKIEVGVFLSSAVTLLVAALLVLAGWPRRHQDYYYLEFNESTAGLSEGSKVTYNGVPVGKITDLVVTRDNRVGITIGVDPSKVTLHEGVKAKQVMETLFGPTVIDLFGGDDSTKPFLEPGCRIPVRGSLMAGIEQDVPGALGDVRVLINSLSNVFSKVKSDDVPNLLHDADTLAKRTDRLLSKVQPEDLQQVVRRLDHLLLTANTTLLEVRGQTRKLGSSLDGTLQSARTEIQATSQQAKETLKKVQDAAAKAETFLGTAQAAIQENRTAIDTALKDFSILTDKAAKTFARLDLPGLEKSLRGSADSVSKAALAVDRAVGGLERPLVRALDELDLTLRAARSLFDTIERDPSALIHGKREQPR